MKLSGAKIDQYLQKGKPTALTLVYGANKNRTRKIIQDFSKTTLGETASEEMRLEAFDFKSLAQDPAKLNDTMRATGFFPGPKAVLIYDLTDSGVGLLVEALSHWQQDDGYIIAQAGSLKKTSKLLKQFQSDPNASLIAIYDDALNAQAIEAIIARSDLKLELSAQKALIEFAQSYDAEPMERLIETIALYQGQDQTPMNLSVLESLLPQAGAALADEIVTMMMRGDAPKMVTHLRRAPGQGIGLGQISALANMRINQLIRLKAAPNPANAIVKLRPPVFGQRRANLETALRSWSSTRLEQSLAHLTQADAELRSGQSNIPEAAYMERCFLRIAMLARARV